MILAFVLTVISAISADPTVQTEHAAALENARGFPLSDSIHLRYLTTYNQTPVDRQQCEIVMRFWLNSLSTRKRITPPAQVSPTLWRIDLRDYHIPPDAWEKLIKEQPYFRLRWLPSEPTHQLCAITQSSCAIVRADWFLAQTSIEPHYSNFLKLPNTLEALKKSLGVQDELAITESSEVGGNANSGVVVHNTRIVARTPYRHGAFWQSFDVNNGKGQRNALETFLRFKQFDGGESIWNLANGGQAYYLSNGAGNQVNAVPPEIAHDSVTKFRDKTVRNARSCVVCHSLVDGIQPIEDKISGLIRTGLVRLLTFDKTDANRIEDFYLSNRDKLVIQDQARYAAFCEEACGVKPKELATAFETVIWNYSERHVDKAIAARELGTTEETIVGMAKRLTSGTVGSLAAGNSVPRDSFESEAFGELAHLHYLGGNK